MCAGLAPSLLIAVPATGVYYGIQDIVKRGLLKTQLGDINVALLSEFFADVVALMICTPADALAIQLQTATGKEAQESKAGTEEERAAIKLEKVGDWFIESIEHLPAVILTDLPYLLSRIALNQVLIQGEMNIGGMKLYPFRQRCFVPF